MRGSNKAGGASCGARDHGDDGGVAHFGAQASGIAARSGATESRSVGGRAVLPNGSPGLFAGPGGPANKKGLSFTIKDRPSTCGATFIGPAYAEPSHEHANTCSASNAGSRSRYSVGLHRAFAPLRRSFPLSLGEPFTAQLPTGIPAAPALCECS